MSFLKAVFERPWVPALLLLILLLLLSLNHFLFWDTVQFGSLHPNYYFQTDWASFWLPPELDSGHPPFFGHYIALWWTLFGKSLPVSHLAMWPNVLGIFIQLWRFLKSNFDQATPWLLLALLLEPVLLGQITLVSPDLVLVFAFLLGINEINSVKQRWLILAIIILGMISTRGMMLGVVLFLWYWLSEGKRSLFWKKLRKFIPGGVLGAVFLLAHYLEFGWIGYHEGSTWAPAFESVDFKGLIRNFFIIIIHLLDFGHIFLLGIIGWTAYKNWPALKLDVVFRKYALLAFLLLLFLLPTLVLHKYLFNHRYLLSYFLVFDFLVLWCINKYWRKRQWGITGATLLLLVGSFWIYPQPIATSWDSTILHWGYYPARTEMMNFIEVNKIPLDQIGTAFPNINAEAVIDLKGSAISFPKKDLDIHNWIFYSNVMNDFSAEDLEKLKREFEPVQEYSYWPVRVILYSRKNREVIGQMGHPLF